ncbi:hypothetical protein FNV43_RR02760 [Rhamnella rubrinervis]|uniref:F-box domain-containing protein n=1 Tax=Rhamnella rubrinervis TaxID=2594499 RepID=A0A8K0HGG8_9ROSA|nr:hypothetical protein FNV43_RR02760 [Rhamnella rubrinervis]
MNENDVHPALTCDDILCEILLRLPEKSVFKCILVSKRWLHLMCSSSFRYGYCTRWKTNFHLVGFFVSNHLYLGRHKNGIQRPPSEPAIQLLSTSDEGDVLKFSGVLKQLGYFIDSSNGLLLCGRHPMTYYVWNPMTKQTYQLPQPRQYYKNLCMAFFIENCSDETLHYKVIRARCDCRLIEVNTVSVEIFSSATGMWKHFTLTCSSPFGLSPWTVATVINGVIYWFAKQGNIAIFDPHLGERCIVLVKLPTGKLSYDYDENGVGESSDGLLQYGQSSNLGIEIWVLEKEQVCFSSSNTSHKDLKNRWTLRYRLSFKAMWKQNPSYGKHSKESQILSFLPQNSDYVFIRSGCYIFRCHLSSKRLEVVHSSGRGSSILWDFSKVVPYFRPVWPHSSICRNI